ncbi:MAG: DsbA family protein [Oscillospiraceae bacterium]|nr:DsbA family protein [Oscillospiraceae bacterium]
MAKIEVFIDNTCPYCDRGIQHLLEVLPDYPKAEIVWRPVEAHPKHEEPEHRPWNNLAVQASLCVKDQGANEVAFFQRLYKAHFEEKISVEEIAVLAKCAGEIGADSAKVEAALKDGTYEKQMYAANDYAYEEKEVWAVPTFIAEKARLDAVGGIGVMKNQVEALLAEVCK